MTLGSALAFAPLFLRHSVFCLQVPVCGPNPHGAAGGPGWWWVADVCPLQTFQTSAPPAPSPRTSPERWAVSGPPYSPCLADPPPGPQAALPPPPLSPLSQQCWGPCTSAAFACMLGSLCTQSSTGPDASPCHSSPWGQNPGVEWTGTERTCEGEAGAPACLLATASPRRGAVGTPVSPAWVHSPPRPVWDAGEAAGL